jgi:dihydropteroate synthase
MQHDPRYDDVVDEVRRRLRQLTDTARNAGVPEVWVDPGIGFAKTAAHNLSLLRHLDALVADGAPVLVGTSRKGFLGTVGPGVDGRPAPVGERTPASLATAVWSMLSGAAMVRVHDVAATVAAATLVGGQRGPAVGAPCSGGRRDVGGPGAAGPGRGVPPLPATAVGRGPRGRR